MAHIRPSRPDPGLRFQVKVLYRFKFYCLRSGAGGGLAPPLSCGTLISERVSPRVFAIEVFLGTNRGAYELPSAAEQGENTLK